MGQAAVRALLVLAMALGLGGCSGCGSGGGARGAGRPGTLDGAVDSADASTAWPDAQTNSMVGDGADGALAGDGDGALAGDGDGALAGDGGGALAGDGDGALSSDAGARDASVGMDAGGGADAGDGSTAQDAGQDADEVVDESSYESDGAEDAPLPTPDAGTCEDGLFAEGALRPGVKVLINEIVITPRRDWGHTQTKRNRFDGTAEDGLVDTSDQYVELYNAGSVPLDMRDWVLEIRDAASSHTTLGKGARSGVVTTLSAGSTLASFQPGAYMLVGNPIGYSSTDAFYRLLTPCGDLVDDVEVGGNTASRNTERDALSDGAPAAGENGRSRGLFDEAIARVPDHADSDDDIADFAAMRATPLRENVFDGVDPSDQVSPRVIANPSSERSFPVSGAIRVQFDEPLDGWSAVGASYNAASPAIVLSAGGVAVALSAPEFEHEDRTLIINPVGVLPFDSDITVSLSENGTSLRDLSNNPMVPASFTFHTEPAPPANPSVVLNEIVADPRHDWGATQFDGSAPGVDAVSSEDEWIELLNRGAGATDLSGYVVVIFNGPNPTSSTRAVFTLGAAALGSSSVVRVFGEGLDLMASRAGDYVVIGNPPGSISVNTWVELRGASGKAVEDGTGELLDCVEIGGNSAAEDRGGDGTRNGAPAAGKDGSSDDASNESISRVQGGTDTNDDIADFCRAPATLGRINSALCEAGS